jgi:membrane-bound metal-dependent hydrolase YbcI (DUF457 family)
MDSLFHFIFPLIAAVAARIHVKHRIETVLGLSLAAVLIDLDVFFIHHATLHNLFITALLPLILILLAFKFENPKKTKYKTITIALFLFLVSHPILDMFTEGGIQLFYPLSTQLYNFEFGWSLGYGYVVSAAGIGLTIYFILILLVLFLEDFISYYKKEPVKKALFDTIKKEERKIKKEL